MNVVQEILIDLMLQVIKDNIILYCEEENDYFKTLKDVMNTIKENGEYFRFIVEDHKMFYTLLEEIINDINLLPNIYNIRNDV